MKIGKYSSEWALIEALLTHTEMNRNDLKGVSQELLEQIDKSLSDRAIDNSIRRLKKNGILQSEKIGKYAIYKINPEADWEYLDIDLRTKKGEKDKHIGKNAIASYLRYKEHTNDLKKVIKQWLKEFPIVSIDGVHIPSPVMIGVSEWHFRGSGEVKLPVESEDKFLFNDLILHLEKQNLKIVEKWNEFRDKSIRHNEIGKELISKLEKEITIQVNGILPKEVGNLMLEISSGFEVNSISENFLNFVFHACVPWIEVENKDFEVQYKNFKEKYKNFESRIQYKGDSLEYWIEDMGFVRIEKGLLDEEIFKNEVNNIINNLVEKSKVNCYHSLGKEIVNLTEELTTLGDEIKRLLKKQLLYVVFKWECRYLENDNSPRSIIK